MTHDRDRRGLRADVEQEPRILSLQAGRASSLQGQLESLVAGQRASAGTEVGRVHVTIDVPIDAHLAVEAPLADALTRLVSAAFATAVHPDPASDVPHVPEVVITGVVAGGGLELEIASSGSPPPEAEAEVAAAQAALERSGATLAIGRCPEGGRAVTLRFPRRAVRRQAA